MIFGALNDEFAHKFKFAKVIESLIAKPNDLVGMRVLADET